MMDVVMLARLQFAVTCMFHFIFVPLTLGLSILVAWMEWRHVRTGDEGWRRLARFWGKLFLINFALGVVTGITMEFQFGMNWAEYAKYVGDIFGTPLAIEATVAFFLESVFIGVWAFGWDKVSRRTHAWAITLVALGTNLSAVWILLANGWMQNPVGAEVRRLAGNPLLAERAEMADVLAVLANPYGWLKFLHTVSAAHAYAAFFVLGVSAWHILRGNETALFKRSFMAGAVFGLAACLAVMGIGDKHAVHVAAVQPTKLAAMEAVWETQPGGTGFPLLAVPDEAHERNAVEALVVPGLASFLSYRDATRPIKGLKEFRPEDRPPVAVTFYSFRLMVAIGLAMLALAALAAFVAWRDAYATWPRLLRLLPWFIPVPLLAIQLGWVVAEVGRQPWIVYGIMRTSDAVSRTVSAAQVATSLACFTVLYSFLGAVDVYLLVKYARKGPESAAPPRKEA